VLFFEIDLVVFAEEFELCAGLLEELLVEVLACCLAAVWPVLVLAGALAFEVFADEAV